jgi:hypothetical protein
MPVPRISDDRLNKQVWVAGRDLDFARLKVAKGEPLPEKWQQLSHVRWLRQQHGEDIVVSRTSQAVAMDAGRPAPRRPGR